MSLETNRRHNSKSLLYYLFSYGYPHDNSWSSFKPNIGEKTETLFQKLLVKFKRSIPVIKQELKSVKKVKQQTDPVWSRYGIFIDYIVKICQNEEFQRHNQELAKDILERHSQRDKVGLQDILNQKYRELVPYWEACQKTGQTHCSCHNNLKDIYNYFASPDIQEEVEKYYTTSLKVKGTLFHKPFNLIIHYNPETGIKKGLLESLQIRLGLMLSLNADVNKGENVNVQIWMTDKPKLLNTSRGDKFIGIKNVNSGCTIKDPNISPVGRIIIWREEECEKVLVHELIHALSLDFFDYDTGIDRQIVNLFDLHDPKNINIFETYTESWTIIISSVINSLLSGKGSVKEGLNALVLELAFSFVQIAKILTFYGYSSFAKCHFFCPQGFDKFHQETKVKPSGKGIKNGLFHQGSSILAYYILKTALLYNLEEFVVYCNPKRKDPWQFRGDPKKLWLLIKKSLMRPEFTQMVESILKNYQMLNRDDQLLDLSLRMTLNEFQLNS